MSLRWTAVILPSLFWLASCGDSSRSPEETASLDQQVHALAVAQQQMMDPAAGQQAITPAQSPVIKLGQLLFFSKTLGGTFDTACASCHHPALAGGDALSLPVGVAALNPDFLGPGRLLNPANDFDPVRDNLPNVPRNSQTIINVGLYHQAMFFDGRVQTLDIDGFNNLLIRTPDSASGADSGAGNSLLEAQARFPVTSPDEMRNFFHPELGETELFRELLVSRLKGLADADSLDSNGPANWLARFQAAYGAGTSDSLITYVNIQKAIAAYESSLIFVDTPWRQYLAGNESAISDTAKKGALLFMRPVSEGGLGCSGCHSGSFFTDEKFHNIGFPQIGRGKRPDGRDFGRWQVTKQDADKFAFRTPSLLNISLGAPYGHAGTFQTLDQLLRYHANPKSQVNSFDFTLQHLLQYQGVSPVYANAQAYTLEAVNSPNLSNKVPGRDLTNDEVAKLTAFLETLSSKCLSESMVNCLAAWVPAKAEDPDGNLLVKSDSPAAPEGSGNMTPPVLYPPPEDAPDSDPTVVALSPLPGLASRTTFPDAEGCSVNPVAKVNNDGHYFSESATSLGLTIPHGFDLSTWKYLNGLYFPSLLMSGGVSSGYLDGDCWPDIAYASGSANGVIIYRNNDGQGFSVADVMPSISQIGTRHTGVGIVDLQGDYRRELVLGNVLSGHVQILKPDDSGQYSQVAQLATSRNTFGMAFGDYNSDGYPDMYLGHWDPGGLPGTAPAFWQNNAGNTVSFVDGKVGVVTSRGISPNWHFAPAFTDIDSDGKQDLLVVADFGATLIMRNNGAGAFVNVTDRSVITDENGMGSAFGDFRNVGALDWFVTSIYDPSQIENANWGGTGNRMYRNDSTPGNVKFADVTEQAGVRDGLWGWGACAADFNNDGWLDIFQVNGWGSLPSFPDLTAEEQAAVDTFTAMTLVFNTKPGRLFMNKGDGTFTEKATEWQIALPMNGRGLTCFDFDQDGDMDVAVLDHSKGIKLFENHSGSGTGEGFVSLRLVGLSPNTDALGAKVYVTADLNGDGAIGANETQMRVVSANSNFNSQDPLDMHFGLGSAAAVKKVHIVWPNGDTQDLTDLPKNQFLIYHQ